MPQTAQRGFSQELHQHEYNNGQKYVDTAAHKHLLHDSTPPALCSSLGKNPFLFLQDRVPVHKARPIQTWTEEFQCPAQSPDLPNPTEHLWNALER